MTEFPSKRRLDLCVVIIDVTIATTLIDAIIIGITTAIIIVVVKIPL